MGRSSRSSSIGWVIYYFAQHSAAGAQGARLRDRAGANRKPYYDDETLEGPRLERVQLARRAAAGHMVIGLPLYWVLEPEPPGRRRRASKERQFVELGSRSCSRPTADGGFNCAGCHGGMKATGGQAPYTVTDPETGEVRAVNWNAPALNTVLYRFSDDEVRFILNYGRPFSPMSAWGLAGGGPMNDQQIETLHRLPAEHPDPARGLPDRREPCRADDLTSEVCDGGTCPPTQKAKIDKAASRRTEAGRRASTRRSTQQGEALFNLDLASGAYSCARCHTRAGATASPA